MQTPQSLLPAIALLAFACKGDPEDTDSASTDDTSNPVETELRELSYDDGRGDSLAVGPLAGSAIAVRFTAPQGATLDAARFFVTDEGVPDTAFGVQVLAATDDGLPGDVLWPTDGSVSTAARSGTEGLEWVEVDTADAGVDVSGDFFVAMTWLTAPGTDVNQAQRLGYDLSEPDGRTLISTGAGWKTPTAALGIPDLDALIRARVAVPVGSLPAEPGVLRHVDDACTEYAPAGPSSGDEGSWGATRFEAGATDFAVDFVRLQLVHTEPFGGYCDATLPFVVELSRGSGPVPDAEPVVIEQFSITLADLVDIPVVQLDLEPATALELAAGETLFVTVQMHRDGDLATCLDVCTNPVIDDVDAWTYDTAPPYTWSTFTELGVSANMNIAVFGTAGG